MSQSTGDKVLDALRNRNLKLKDERGGNWRCNSPFRQDANSQSFTLRVDTDGEHGAWDDKAGGESGSLYDLATRLGVALPERTEVASTKRAYASLDEYATAHGVPGEVLRANGWSDVEKKNGRPALQFKTPTGPRWRFIDGNKPPYWHASGYKACWYALKKAIDVANEMLSPLVLVNGEASALVGQHYKIASACFTGSGERSIPDALMDELLRLYPQGEILIALDCDEKGRKASAKIVQQFADRKRAGVRAVDLMLGDKGDIADFCMLHGDGAAERMWELPNAPDAPTKADEDIAALAKSLDGLAAAQRMDARLRKQEDIKLLLANAQALIDKIGMNDISSEVLTLKDIADENKRRLRDAMAHPDPVRGLRSNMRRLDLAIGGFEPEVYVVYGAPGMGKSWLCVSFVRELYKQGNGLIVTTESVPHRWVVRLAAAVSGIDADKQETGQVTDQDAKKVEAAYDVLAQSGIGVLKGTQPTPSQVRAAVLNGLYRHDYKWVVVDSASKMSAPFTNNIYDKTVAVADGLQNLMVEANLPIIATSQVGRDVASRQNKMPTLEDAYGGGAIEQNAGVVMSLYRHQYYVDKGLEQPDPDFPANTALVRILKNRWRGGSQTSGVQLVFGGSRGFYELSEDEYATA